MSGYFAPLDSYGLWIAGWAIKLICCLGLALALQVFIAQALYELEQWTKR